MKARKAELDHLGTHCAGMKVAAYPEKVDFCKGCELIQSLISKNEEPVSDELQRKDMSVQKTVLSIDDNPEAIV